MDRRLRLATVSAVLLAIVLLGVPCAVVAVNLTQSAATTGVTNRCEDVAAWVDSLDSLGLEPDSRLLAGELGRLESPKNWLTGEIGMRVEITSGQDLVAAAGPRIGEPRREEYHGTGTGDVVMCAVSWWSLQLGSLPVVGLVLLAAGVALGAGYLAASRQSKRLSEPLVYLAASAEQVGIGRVKTQPKFSGIEEIDLVAEELSRSADRMARRLSAERQFAADASHQLRTPLTALSMRLEEIELLSNQEEVREEARISLEQIERLSGTIDELLGRSGREHNADTLEALRLADIAAQQEDEWRPVFKALGRQLVVDVPEGLGVLATPGALSQVIATLLENSTKHGGGTTTLTAAKTAGGVAIEVADGGDGVSDELAPHIFERHVTSGGGTGLGLALARDLAAHDGGRLELAQRRPAVFRLFLRAATHLDA
jgi:signal transduction histidine kinase